MERILHDLRLSETITPFGVGAVVDVLGESLIAPDTSWWDRKRAPEISCDRLLARLGAGVLRQAPAHAGRAAKDTDHLLYWRFPAWRFCEQCTRLSKVTGRKNGRWINKCDCGGALVPMRYVAVCRKGSHIQDIPWFKWAHRGTDGGVTEVVRHCRAFTELKFVRSMRHGEGLAALRVHCSACKRSRPLSDLTGEDSLHRDYVRCDGTQPWEEPKPGEVCDHRLVAVQRGATGNYIAERLSALDIPEERPQSAQVTERIRGHLYFDKVVADNGGPQAEMVAGWIAGEVGVTAEEVLRVAAGDDDSADTPLLDLKDGEWAAFLGKLEAGRDDGAGDFVVDGWKVPAGPKWPSSLTSHLVNVGQVRRVREVRALRGFRRHDAEADLIPADLGPDRRRMPVYPAVEVFGEGIFLRFDEERLSHWENLPKVRDRAEILVDRRAASQWAHRLDSPSPASSPCTRSPTCSSAGSRSPAATHRRHSRKGSTPTPTVRTAPPASSSTPLRATPRAHSADSSDSAPPTSSSRCYWPPSTTRMSARTIPCASRATIRVPPRSTCRHATAARSSARPRARRRTACWTANSSSAVGTCPASSRPSLTKLGAGRSCSATTSNERPRVHRVFPGTGGTRRQLLQARG